MLPQPLGLSLPLQHWLRAEKNTLPAYAATQTDFGRLAIEHKYHRELSLFRQNRCIHNSETKIKQ